MTESGQSFGPTPRADLRWSPALSAWVQVLDERRLFGRDVAQVRVLGDDRVLNVASAGLAPERPPDLQGALATLATARIWQALGSDLLLAPLLSKVLPLPHQFRALRKTMGRFPVRMLLADEVGMGKTIEAGLVLKELKLRGLVERVLILAPKSLLLQWIAEMQGLFGERFDLGLPGDSGADADLSENAWRRSTQVVTSIDSVKPKDAHKGWSRERLDRYNLTRFHDLVGAGWDLVICDEAHKLAGASDDVARYQLASELARVTPHLLLLSATPHSGKGDAFRRLLSLLDPETFHGTADLSRPSVEPWVVRTDKRSATDDAGRALFAPRTTRLLAVELDERHAHQAELYESVSHYVAEHYNAASAKTTTGQAWRLLLILLQRLVSSSTRAVKSYLERRLQILTDQQARFEAEGTDEQPALWEDDPEAWAGILVDRLPALAGERAEVERLVALCGQVELAGPDARTEQLVDLFREQVRIDNEPGKKFLVFTEFTATQAMLADHLRQRGFEVSLLNGSMDLAQRQAAQSAFRGPSQVLIATDAGGEGLNLQFAHVIINYDLPWAPMRVEQRIGRVDRIGQKREVRAFNLVLRNSVEERLYDIWQHKLATILAEYGVDKTGDVLDSSEAEAQFERLARTAILQPATFDNELDKVLTELRKAAAKASETRQLYQGAVAAEDKVPALPLKAWLDTLRGQTQTSLLTEPDDADFSTELVERVRALRPYAAPGCAAVVLDVTGIGFEVEGWLTLYKLALGHQAIRQQRVFALVINDAGQVFVQAGQRLWDALAARRVEVRLDGSIPPPDSAWLQQLAEQQAAEDFEVLLERTRAVAEQRLSAERLSAARRRDAFSRLADPTVRALRLRQLETDHATRTKNIRAAAEEMPALECLLVARVRAR